MSVLTVTNTVPGRAFTLHESPLISSAPRKLSQVPTELPATYTRAVAQKSQPAAANTHRHSRSASSNTINSNYTAAPRPGVAEHQSSSTPVSTPSTASRISQSSANMQRQGTTGSNSNGSLPRRSTSGRSVATNSPSSYVALMRKQKATVWCDRAQAIDSRVAAQQKAAKQRAVLEVVGTNSQRTSTITSGSMVGKIRHGGVAKAPHYTAPNTIGANVPPRLLAFDLQDEEEQEGRVLGDNNMAHARTGSGKSSIKSGIYRSGYPRPHHGSPEGGSPAHEGIPEAGETPHVEQQKENYFDMQTKSSDEEDSFGELREMTGPNSKQQALDAKAKEEDLRRRGSVDERTTTMTSKQRLFITNPDRD